MAARSLKCHLLFSVLSGLLLLAGPPAGKCGQVPGAPDPASGLDVNAMVYGSANAEIYVKGPNGAPIDRPVVVTLFRVGGQLYAQDTTKGGLAKFDRVPYSEFTAQVIASGYQTATKRFEISGPGGATVTFELQPLEAEDAAASQGFYSLPPKVQKDVGKALEALRANKPNDAWRPLQAAQKNAPNNPEVDYLLGLYASQRKDDAQARSYWTKTLELNPKHLSALISLGQELLQEKKPSEAAPYLKRAVEAAPSSWRAHALFAEALVLQGQNDDAIKNANRATELGHERAATAQLVVVRAMMQKGDKPGAMQMLETYVRGHPADKDSAQYFERLKNPPAAGAAGDADAGGEMGALESAATALPVPSNWLPPDVDEKVPPVEAGAACNVNDVVRNAGQRLIELVHDVDRFSATESLTHESINKYGLPTAPEKRIFDYVVSIQEIQHSFLNVEEYRTVAGSGAPADFPEGVATNGLPALVLIFHPFNAVDFDMTCEGLARWNGGLAWQVHFKQRPDKPNVIKRYRIGVDGPSYPVALKGRVWISADSYQILRLETDLVAPMPQIRLVADHADIEYGPVKFRDGTVNMWLPKSAEVYYIWKGHRIHRRHSFSNYLLFAVDDRQKISVPKTDERTTESSPSGAAKENP
jgi:tetratricopeptide (TPR) repeat protein